MDWISRAAAAITVAVLALAAVVFLAQRRLLYFPDRYALDAAGGEARRLGFEPWQGEGGELLGWRAIRAAGPSAARVVVLHGNAGSALDRGYLRDVLQAPGMPSLDLYLLEYPGYGPRGGVPSEGSLVAAAVDAIDRLATGGRILLVGESLGSAVAARAAAERPGVDGLLLVTPLASAAKVARRHYPWLPPFLLRDRLDAEGALRRYHGPIAFLIAGADEVVFADLGEALHAGYAGPKRRWLQAGRRHNGVIYDPRDPAWRQIVLGLLAGGW